MLDFTIKALNYGVLGLCAVMILLAWRLIRAEQKLPGTGRRSILTAIYVFLGINLITAGLVAWVEVAEHRREYRDCADQTASEAAERLQRGRVERAVVQLVAEFPKITNPEVVQTLKNRQVHGPQGEDPPVTVILECLDVAGLVEANRINEFGLTDLGQKVATLLALKPEVKVAAPGAH
jgi:hypothetical protein